EPALLDDRERLGLAEMLMWVIPRGRHLPAKMSDRGVLFVICVERIAEQLLGSVRQARHTELLLLPLAFGADRRRPSHVLEQKRAEHWDQTRPMEVHEDRRVVEEQQGRVGHSTSPEQCREIVVRELRSLLGLV